MASIMQKFKDMWTPPDDEFDYEEEQEENNELQSNERTSFEEIKEQPKRNFSHNLNNKVVNLHSGSNLQVSLFKPERFGEETRTIADALLKMHTIILNLENTSNDVSRRIVDFLSGVAYANGGKIKRVANNTFIITPYNVDLSGDDMMFENIEGSGVYF